MKLSFFKGAINAMAVNPVTLVLVNHAPTKTNVQDKFVTNLKILIVSILKFGLHIKYHFSFSNLTCENGKQEAMNVIAETTLIWTHVTLETVVGDRLHER